MITHERHLPTIRSKTMNERVLKWFLHSNNFVEIRSFDDTHAPRQMALLFFHL